MKKSFLAYSGKATPKKFLINAWLALYASVSSQLPQL